jgi:soluble lytic murein transglycosylase
MAFQAALAAAPDQETASQARLGLGRAFLSEKAYLSAAPPLEDLIELSPTSPLTPTAHFLLAEAHLGAGNPLSATILYQTYLAMGTPAAAYIHERAGDALYQAGDYLGAIEAYQAALDSPPDLSFAVDARDKLALAYTAVSDYESALAEYDTILAQAEIPEYRARIAHQAAQLLVLAGQIEAAMARHLEVVEAVPTSPWAYESLVVLVESGVVVDDLTRGIVDYHAQAYDAAVAALYRYAESNPDHSGEPLYYAGLSHLAAGSPELAEIQFRTLVEDYVESPYWGDGYMAWAEARNAAGDLDRAVDTYRTFALSAPFHSRAPEALWKAAQLLERAGRVDDAAQAYQACQATFPASEYAPPALLRAGLQHYRAGRAAAALTVWQKLTDDYPGSEYEASGWLWQGKAHLAAGQPVSATAAFSQAVGISPTAYYGLRAADLLADPAAEVFRPQAYAPAPHPDAGRDSAEIWLAGWLGLPSASGLGQLSTELEADPRLQRGLTLWHLGLRDEAKTELEALRRATVSDALTQYRLALLFRDIGLYRSSILAAANLIRLSPAASPLEAPPFLGRLAYPTYYEDLILSNALTEGLPPLVVFPQIRQESLFEGFATSWAYAHGLMQVIPSTGAAIASQLAWPPDYDTEDLYRPLVSVRFGTHYLAEQRDRFEGRMDVALAAYNGGPGNAARWLEAAGSDPDMFLELITLGETRLYLERIREQYAVYSALY